MMLAPNSNAPKEVKKSGQGKGKNGRFWDEEKEDADCGETVRPSQEEVRMSEKRFGGEGIWHEKFDDSDITVGIPWSLQR